MSEQNVKVIKSAYEAFARGDIPGVLANFDAGIEWTTPDSLPFGGTFRGHDQVLGFFQKLPQYFQELRVEPDEYIDAGDRVITRGFHRGRGKGGSFVVPFAMFWTVRNGKAVQFTEYQDTAKTLKAVAV